MTAEPPRFHVVGPNPAMDRTQFVDNLRPGEVHHASSSHALAGGKGFIVARTMVRLGERVALYGFAGGTVGRFIRSACSQLGILDRHVVVDGETRVNTIIVERSSGRATVLNEAGPRVPTDGGEGLIASVRAGIQGIDRPTVVLSGSFPPGLSPGFAGEMVAALRHQGRVIVDTHGQPLREAIDARPWAVKCNLDEIRHVYPGIPPQVVTRAEVDELVSGLRAIDISADVVIITLGAHGAVLVSPRLAIWARPPRIRVANATGSGDAFLAGFLSAVGATESAHDVMRRATAVAAANTERELPDVGPDPDFAHLEAETSIVVLDGDAEVPL